MRTEVRGLCYSAIFDTDKEKVVISLGRKGCRHFLYESGNPDLQRVFPENCLRIIRISDMINDGVCGGCRFIRKRPVCKAGAKRKGSAGREKSGKPARQKRGQEIKEEANGGKSNYRSAMGR